MIASTSASFLQPDNDGKAAVVRLKRSYVKAIASPRPPAAAKRRRAAPEGRKLSEEGKRFCICCLLSGGEVVIVRPEGGWYNKDGQQR